MRFYSDSIQTCPFGGRLCSGPWGKSWTNIHWFKNLANWRKSLQELSSAQIKKKYVLCTKFLLQSLFWSLDLKRWRRNFKVQRSNTVLAIQKSVLISGKELVLSEIGENLSVWPSSFLSSLCQVHCDSSLCQVSLCVFVCRIIDINLIKNYYLTADYYRWFWYQCLECKKSNISI